METSKLVADAYRSLTNITEELIKLESLGVLINTYQNWIRPLSKEMTEAMNSKLGTPSEVPEDVKPSQLTRVARYEKYYQILCDDYKNKSQFFVQFGDTKTAPRFGYRAPEKLPHHLRGSDVVLLYTEFLAGCFQNLSITEREEAKDFCAYLKDTKRLIRKNMNCYIQKQQKEWMGLILTPPKSQS
jgi:hypothetical protein